jgi:hypothetical protein
MTQMASQKDLRGIVQFAGVYLYPFGGEVVMVLGNSSPLYPSTGSTIAMTPGGDLFDFVLNNSKFGRILPESTVR